VVGEIDPKLRVGLSEAEISHVLLNVILNALKASSASDGQVALEVSTGMPPSCSTRNAYRRMISISVSDRGSGAHGSLLQSCYRTLSWERGRFVGKNLGTLLCRMIVERAGGQIEVESSPGRGTTVTVFLPEVG
jgi:signal transduction histidine kinase